MKFTKTNFFRETLRRAIAAALLSAIFSLGLTGVNAQQMNAPSAPKTATAQAKPLTEEQKIIHVLNRLGHGARPGDVEKVKAMGLNRYIEQQLDAGKIDDAAAEAKVKNFDALKMSNAELFGRYPNPAAALQIVARNNDLNARQLRGDFKADRKAKKNGVEAMTDNGETAGNAGAPQMPEQVNPATLTDAERREYQRQVAEIYRRYDLRRPAEMSQQLVASRILRAVYSERQLHEQMVDFWTNHFNVYAGKAAVRWFLPEYDRDVVRPNALGNFRDLLVATAQSPAMLFYLDNFQSVAPNNDQNNRRANRLLRAGGQINPRQMERLRARGLTDEQIEQRRTQMQQPKRPQRGINENYARELMELHTLGVDGGYTQKDIQEIARCFTGWTIIDPRGYRKAASKLASETDNKAIRGIQILAGLPVDAESGTFYFNARQHDAGEKIVLGRKIKAGGGIEDGLQVIDILTSHPATAKFVARKLAVKFVSDNPSDALVSRVADAFRKSNGDIKTTLRALFTAPEFFAPENYRAKIKTPFEVLASAIRTLGADTNASPALQGLLAKMGEPLYGYIAPTGYPDTAQDWVNTGALLERLNFGLALAANRIPGTRLDLTRFSGRDPDSKEKVMETYLGVVLHGEVAPATRATLVKQLAQPLPEPKLEAADDDEDAMIEDAAMQRPNGGKAGGRNGINRANRLLPATGNQETIKIVGLILGSPDFQRQ